MEIESPWDPFVALCQLATPVDAYIPADSSPKVKTRKLRTLCFNPSDSE